MYLRKRHDLSVTALRAFIATIQHGSVSRAAEALHITQPAVSVQLKRLQQVLGGNLFVKTAAGRGLSELGLRLEQYARRIVALNDQAIAAAGRNLLRRTIYFGVQSVFARILFSDLVRLRQASTTVTWEFFADSAPALAEKYKAGYLDVAVMVAPPEALPNVAAEWNEQLVWVRAPNIFPVTAGEPIPFIARNNGYIDRKVFEVLNQCDVPYRIAFQAGEMTTMIAAVEAGLGVFAVPERCVPASLIAARETVLPRLPRVRVAVFYREGLDIRRLKSEVTAFISLVQPPTGKVINLRQSALINPKPARVPR